MRRWNVVGMLVYLVLVLFLIFVARMLCDDKGSWWSSCRPMPWDQGEHSPGEHSP